MQISKREFGHRYETYEFGYTTYAKTEVGDNIDTLYSSGFLPYSADPSVHDLSYMARSVRVPLERFTLSSENRRIARKFTEQFTTRILTRDELLADPEFLPCFLSYFKTRHGERVMSEERARGILASILPLRGIQYQKDGATIGYVIEVVGPGFSHYWFSCYTEAYAGTSFGMWLMQSAVERAKLEDRSYIYLGTAYGAKGRYKANFQPLQFWDGSEWKEDQSLLKECIRKDIEG